MAHRSAAKTYQRGRGQTSGDPGTVSGVLALSGTAQGRLIREGSISSAELLEAHISRIEKVNPALNAVIEVLRDPARDAARMADQRRAEGALLGPLDGVPFSIKDSIEIAGTVCTAGTTGLRNAPASQNDATLVARLRAGSDSARSDQSSGSSLRF